MPVSAASASRRRPRRLVAEMNVVPYIDVMLVLLVIFMVSAPLLAPGVVDLPTVGKAPTAKALPFEIIVKANGVFTWRDRNDPVGRETAATLQEIVQLARQRQQTQAHLPVVISADKTVQYDAVMKVMNALYQQGVQRVGLAVVSGA